MELKGSSPWDIVDLNSARGLALLIQDALRVGEESALSTSILVRLNEERLRSVESLQSLASELAHMVQSANLPVLAVSNEGIITEWNEKVVEMSGIRREAVLGSALTDVLTRASAEAAAAAIAKALASSEQARRVQGFRPTLQKACKTALKPAVKCGETRTRCTWS